MDFRILGPLEASTGGRPLALGGPKQRALLAVLLLHANEVVSTDRLIEALWGESPPDSAPKALQGNMLALRKALEPGRKQGEDWTTIVTHPPGYVLRVEPGQLDLERFKERCAEGRAALAHRDPGRAAALLREALDIWRGPPLSDLAFEAFAQQEIGRLEELRLAALEERIEADLALGRHSELVAELESLVGREPLRERPRGQLMLCLYRCGRQADALACYRVGREFLVDELGIEPSPTLERLQEAILQQDPALDGPPGTPPAGWLSGAVTFLLTDIKGSTELWERDPARMSSAVARHEELLAEAAQRHGGMVVKSRGEGDSAFIVFEDAPSALDAALSAQLALDAEPWPTPEPLLVRMAVHTGEAEVRDDDFFGPTVIRCARLRGTAHGGQVLVSRATAEAAKDRLPAKLELRLLGAHRLKGLTQPELVFQLSHPELRSDFPLLEHEFRTEKPVLPPALQIAADRPFVGRARELEELRTRWRQACGGRPQLVPLAGEAGIGKTRLAAELARELQDEGTFLLYGRCDEEPLAAHQPFIEALRQLVRDSPGELVRALPGALAGELSRLLPELRERFRDLPKPVVGDPEGERYRLFEAITALVAAASRERPVALMLDDLHWADRSTVLLLKHLVRQVGEARLLVVVMYRADEVGREHPLAQALADLRRDGEFERLVLSGLDRDAVAELVAEWSGGETDRDVVRSLHERSGGHPFFLVELLRHARQAPGEAVPEGVRELVRRRLVALGDGARQALPLAAVIGATFSWELLERLAGLPAEALEEAVDDALAAMLIEEDSAAVGQYWFSHALVRDALYEDLSATRRARVHHRVGEALESVHGPDSPETLPALAHHFLAARLGGDVEKGVAYSVRAGEQAAEQLAFEDGAAHYERALEALALLDRPTKRDRLRLLLALGHLRWAAGEVERSRREFARAAELAEQLGATEDLGRAALGFGGVYPSFGAGFADPQLVSLLERALAALGDHDSALKAMIMARLAATLAFSPARERAAPLAARAITLVRGTGDKRALAEVLIAVLWSTGGPDNLPERLEMTREIRTLGRELGDKRLECEGYGWGLNARLELGDRTGADQEMAEFERLAAELRLPFPQWAAAQHRAVQALLDGRFEEAEGLMFEALEMGQATEIPNATMQFGVQLVHLRHQQARLGELLESLEWLAGEYPALPAWRCALAWAYGETGREEAARPVLAELARDRFAALPRDLLWLSDIAVLARSAARLDDQTHAKVLYDLLLPYADRCLVDAPGASCSGSLSREIGMLARTLGRLDDAERHLRRALEIDRGLRAPPHVADTSFQLASMLIERARPGDHDEALELLRRVGSAVREMRMSRLLGPVSELEARVGVRSRVA